MSTVTIDPQTSLAEIILSGNLNMADLIAAYEKMVSMPEFHPGIHALWDLRGCRLDNVSTVDFQSFAARVREKTLPVASRMAIVAGSDLEYGLGRMWDYLAHGVPQDRQSFRDIEKARTWLVASEL